MQKGERQGVIRLVDEIRIMKYLDEAIDFVKVAVLMSKEVVISKTKDGYIVKAIGMREI
jgi:hypothetical protein